MRGIAAFALLSLANTFAGQGLADDEPIPAFAAAIFQKLELQEPDANLSMKKFHQVTGITADAFLHYDLGERASSHTEYVYRLGNEHVIQANFFGRPNPGLASYQQPPMELRSVWLSRIENPDAPEKAWKMASIFPRWFKGRGIVRNETEYLEWIRTPPGFPLGSRVRHHGSPGGLDFDEISEVRVLLPDYYEAEKEKRHRVLYVLPVEPEFQDKFGYGLREFAKLDVHNKHDLILVQPAFEITPWYVDRDQSTDLHQGTVMKEALVPMIEENYRVIEEPGGRLLIGFSKSGWGAFSLIIRDPDFWGYAASWDSPMMLDRLVFGMRSTIGTQEQLDRFRPDLMARDSDLAAPFQKRTRLVLTGEKTWGVNREVPAPGGGSHTVEFHQLLERHGILHFYDNTLAFPHRWDDRWMEPTLKALMKLADSKDESGSRGR